MEPYFTNHETTIWHGKCVDVMRTMDACSVDAIVTDPPYNLEFMGKGWDKYASPKAFQAWCEEWAVEALRVLKPGGHLVAFGGTRTWHRLACGVEDAGFELRDSLAWLYGSGFPKSLDVSKAIDARATINDGTKRRIALVAEVIRTHREAKGLERAEVSRAVVGTPSGACWNWEHQQLPSVEMWPAIKLTLDIPDKFDGLIEGDRAQFIAAEREVMGERVVPLGHAFAGPTYGGDSSGQTVNITAPATPEAAEWAGFGTALKPGFEPVVMARKPFPGTVAANVLEWGTGALNIDATRIESDRPAQEYTVKRLKPGATLNRTGGNWRPDDPDAPTFSGSTPSGRWPANVILDEDAANELDQQSGTLTSGKAAAGGHIRSATSGVGIYGGGKGLWQEAGSAGELYGDKGGASRFFLIAPPDGPRFKYSAKAPKSERPTVNGVSHATVKPLAVMRWLARLITPPGGTVLDPFGGSGTTMEACLLESFRSVIIDQDAEYLPLMAARFAKPHQLGLDYLT